MAMGSSLLSVVVRPPAAASSRGRSLSVAASRRFRRATMRPGHPQLREAPVSFSAGMVCVVPQPPSAEEDRHDQSAHQRPGMMRGQTFGAAWARQKAAEIAALDHGLEGAEPSRGGVNEGKPRTGERRYVLFNFKTAFCHYSQEDDQVQNVETK